jgi:hypothetical protein
MNNSEVGKWIELWLDRAGERAFQLKGNPGTRFSMKHWHEMYDQVIQLVAAPVAPLITGRDGAHNPILVTNGEMEEDVRAAIKDFNETRVPKYPGARRLQVWTRGNLLELFGRAATSVWPTDIETQVALLRSVAADGYGNIELADIHKIALSVLEWNAPTKPSKPRSTERMAALGMLAGILSSSHVQKGNVFEAIKARALTTTALAGYMERFNLKTRSHKSLYSLARAQLFQTLHEYVNAIAQKHRRVPLINGSVLDEFAIMHARRMLVTALAAIEMIEHEGVVSEDVYQLAMDKIDYPFLDSEALVPPFLAVFWAKNSYSGGYQSDVEMMNVIRTLIKGARTSNLISSYYEIGAAIEARFKQYLGHAWHEIDRDERHNLSQFAFVLVCLLAKRNWKISVKSFWPDITRIARQQTTVTEISEFGLYRSDKSIEETSLIETPMTWAELTARLGETPRPNLPKMLLEDKPLCLLLLVLLPYRATEDVVLWLDRALNRTWY